MKKWTLYTYRFSLDTVHNQKVHKEITHENIIYGHDRNAAVKERSQKLHKKVTKRKMELNK